MPIVNFHLLAGQTSPEQDERLLAEASRLYSELLAAPIERVRAFITVHAPGQFAVGGEPCSRGGAHAPYFECIVFAGRSVEQRQSLLRVFTELLVAVLGVRRELVRGSCRCVAPEDWAIGGVPASVLRAEEVAARARVAEGSGDEA